MPLRSIHMAAVLVIAMIVGGTRASTQGPSPLPAALDSYIKAQLKLTPQQQKQLLSGQPVTQLLDTDPAKEVAIFGAIWIKAPIAQYVAAVRDIEAFEKGNNFLVTKRISSPPRLDDFDLLSIPPEDLADLKACKVGSCDQTERTGIEADPERNRLVEANRSRRRSAIDQTAGAGIRNRILGRRQQPPGGLS